MMRLRVNEAAERLFCCPVCRSDLTRQGDDFACSGSACGIRFPVVDGIPVLLNERSSVFSVDDFVARRATFTPERKKSPKDLLVPFVPNTSKNLRAKENFRKFRELLLEAHARPRVLVIGGSTLGKGMENVLDEPLEAIETDISFGPRTGVICDAHDLPFKDASFDGMVAQAVLEHVVDPYRCAAEIHRVLKKDGVIYAETPFMQQVHAGRYDFTRFTHLGHRRLFRHFDEIDAGVACGPGMALAWSYEQFLLSFTASRKVRSVIRGVSRFTSFYLKYFDDYLATKPGALDSASAFYFLGRKAEAPLSDRDLIALYRGVG